MPTLAAATVNKALSAIGVTLEHAVEEMEVIDGNVAKIVKAMPKKSVEDARLPFEPEDMTRIFTARRPERGGVAPRTLFWILMLAPFTGCRLDELGKRRPGTSRPTMASPTLPSNPIVCASERSKRGRPSG
ncbi:hypothetical protein ACFQ15_17330 [Sphingomonas hankookensis]|uniref:hypothetical protein n=1 Tax=Sphingomonas hankookensis TaxID=563996 RepID=UPI001F564D28|nr:hypothetical protein [Sphingomonas hankookensis]